MNVRIPDCYLVEDLLVFGDIAKGVICQGIEVNVPDQSNVEQEVSNWLGQALGAVLPDGSSRSYLQAQSSVLHTMIAYLRSCESSEDPTLSSLPSASDPHPEIEPAINTHRATHWAPV